MGGHANGTVAAWLQSHARTRGACLALIRGNRWCSTWWLKLKCSLSMTRSVSTLIEFSIGSFDSVWGRMKWLVAM